MAIMPLVAFEAPFGFFPHNYPQMEAITIPHCPRP